MSLFQRVGVHTSATMTKLTTISRRTFNQQSNSLKQAYTTVRQHPNSGLKYLGGVGAITLGGYVAYSMSRPATYVPSETRNIMSTFGGESFARTVRNRIAKTYGYLAGSIVLTGATTFLLFSRGMMATVLSFNPMIFGLGCLACTFGAIHMTMSIDYFNNPLGKHLAWAATNGLVGLSILGLCGMAGGAIVQQAALITGCIIGAMSTAAMVSPNDTFLRMGPYLGVGLGVVIAASLGGMFFPGSTLLMNVSLYGGLGLFGLFSAHDAQRVLHDAQVVPRFDPVSEQMGLYLDSINIFVRVVQILMMQKRK
eukprot:405261_1